jgi:hypothetical protein
MRFWKICLLIMVGVLIFTSIMHLITSQANHNTNIVEVTPLMFYIGVFIIVLSNAVICTVIINCTSRIIKEVNNRQR